MQSKISFFNRTVFMKNLTRFWPVWGFYILVWSCVMVLPLISYFFGNGWDSNGYRITNYMLEAGWAGGASIGAFMGIASAMALWSFLYFPKSAGFNAGLPISRDGLFATNFLSGLSWLIGGNLIVFILALGVEALGGRIELGYLLQWLALTILSGVFFYGFATFIAMLTGNLIVLPVVYGLLNFAVYIVEYIVRGILSSFVYGMPGYTGSMIFQFLSPPVQMALSCRVDSSSVVYSETAGMIVSGAFRFLGWETLAAYCAAGIIFAALALLLYRKRRMETASDTIAIERLKPVFRYCLAVGCALVVGTLLSLLTNSGMASSFGGVNSAVTMLCFMLFGCFIGYFAAEMLIHKSFRVFRGSWRGFFIACAVFIALTLSLELDLFGYERRLPDPSSISEVRLNGGYYGDSIALKERENIEAITRLHGSIIDKKNVYESGAQTPGWYSGYYNGYYEWSFPVNLSYTLNNGSVMTRTYYIRTSEADIDDKSSDYAAFFGIVNSTEAIHYRLTPSLPVIPENISDFSIGYMDKKSGYYQSLYFTSAEAADFYDNCILPDMRDGTIGGYWPVQTEEYYKTVYECDIEIYLTKQVAEGQTVEYGFVRVRPTVDSWRTLDWLREHGVVPMLSYDYSYADKPAEGFASAPDIEIIG